MPVPDPITSNAQLLVEGNDQRNFFEALISHTRHISLQDIQIQNFGGVGELRSFLETLAASDEFKDRVQSLGIIRDAEESAGSAFQSVQSSLRNANLPEPARPREPMDGSPRVNVLILPDDDSPGMLETLLCQTLVSDPVNDCIDTFFECARKLPGADIRRPDKSRAHAYISIHPEPQSSVGVAAQKGYWDLDHSALADVRRFLESL